MRKNKNMSKGPKFPISIIALAVLFLSLCYPLVSGGFVEKRFPYKPEDVLKAARFVKKQGYWEGYDAKNKLIGYVMLSNDWTPHLRGYAGKPINTLIGIDTNGTITGVKVVSYWEPIFMIGIKDSDYHKFLQQYVGRNIKESLLVGREIKMDAITGATVSAIIQNATILGTTRGVAALVGIVPPVKVKIAKKVSEKYEALPWDELIKSGAIKTVAITKRELGMKNEEDVYLEINVGVLTPPSIGRNIVGDRLYKDTVKEIKDGESALFICSTKGAFKGIGFAHGIFGTINVEQEGRIFVFSTDEYKNVIRIHAKGAPPARQSGVFIVRGKEFFDQTEPFKLNITLPYYIGPKKEYKTFTVEYKLPDRFIKK